MNDGPTVRPTRAEVSLGALRANVRAVRAALSEDGAAPKLYGVVKADAYGHGAPAVALALESAGVDGLCVALVEEGVALRAAGVNAPVLVMSSVPGEGLGAAVAAGLTPVVHDVSQLDALGALEGPARVHLKIDSGMHRLGILPEDCARVARRLRAMPHVTVEGVMTHLANADCDDPSYCDVQLGRFAEARAALAAEGVSPPVVHAANSAAALRVPAARFDLVRVGIALYGVAPFPNTAPGLLPAMRLRTEVLALREVGPGEPVGYGGTWKTGRRAVLATIPIGYADGFFRRLSSEAEVLVRGARCRVVGNVSMDLASVDVTEVARVHGVKVGDEVVLLGAQSGAAGFGLIRAEEIAARVGTIAYEVLTALSRRVPRRHVEAFAP